MPRLLILAVFLLSLIGFQNCSSELSVDPNFLCSPSPAHSLKAMSFSAPIHCEDIKNYSCEVRVFKPNIISSTSKTEECLNLDGFGNVCVPIKQINFSTGHIDVANEDSSLFIEGSAYNYKEISCANRLVLHNNKVLFIGESDSLDKALTQSIEKCRAGEVLP